MTQGIIVIGGYNSIWTSYLQLARDLEYLSGLPAVAVPLMPWHWWSASQDKDATNIMGKLQETVAWARRRHRATDFFLVGHSAGGLISRLYLSDQQVWGHRYSGVQHTRMIITLGSPHCGDQDEGTGWFLTDEVNKLVPGSLYSQLVGYRAVVGRGLQARRNGSWQQRRAYRFFGAGADSWGDGAVPIACAALAGAETLVLNGVVHSRKYGPNWYGGSRSIVRRWWLDASGRTC